MRKTFPGVKVILFQDSCIHKIFYEVTQEQMAKQKVKKETNAFYLFICL